MEINKYIGDGRCGGRGKCKYCNEYHNNVALHSAHYCDKNPHNSTSLNEVEIINDEPELFNVKDGL
jgi:hypothetical protein